MTLFCFSGLCQFIGPFVRQELVFERLLVHSTYCVISLVRLCVRQELVFERLRVHSLLFPFRLFPSFAGIFACDNGLRHHLSELVLRRGADSKRIRHNPH